MKIVVLVETPPTLQLEFDPVETEHELFQTAKVEATKSDKVEVMSESIRSYDTTALDVAGAEMVKEDPYLEKLDMEQIPEPEPSILIITGEPIQNEPPITTLGRFVDEIREKYCGDVIPVIDEKTGEDIKDYKQIPRFSIGRMETLETYEAVKVEAEAIIAEAIKEEPIEPIKEEEPIEETPIDIEHEIIKVKK